MTLRKIIYNLFNNSDFLADFLEIHQNYSNNTIEGRIEKGLAQEKLLAKYSPLIQRDFISAEDNATYGDLEYIIMNFDLKVGQGEYTGAISRDSLYKFSQDPTHYYFCTDATFSRVYLINAFNLAKVKKLQKIIDNQGWLGEKDYSYLKNEVDWLMYITR